MKMIEDLPFYLVIIGVVCNLVIGLFLKVSFTALMIRSIFATILFSLIGYIVVSIYDNMNSNTDKETNLSNKPTIDYTVPPIDDEEFIKYKDDEDFVEANPAELYKYKSNT